MIIEFNPFQELFDEDLITRIQNTEKLLLELLPQTERDLLEIKGIKIRAISCSANPEDPYLSFTFTPIGKPILKEIMIQCSIGQKTIEISGKGARKLESIKDIKDTLSWAIKKLTK